MNKNHYSLANIARILSPMITYGMVILVPSPSLSQTVSPNCYMVREDGQLVDLSNFCGQKPSTRPVSPQSQSPQPSEATNPRELNDQPMKEDVSGSLDQEELPTSSDRLEDEIERSELPAVERRLRPLGRQRQMRSGREQLLEEQENMEIR